MGNALGNTAAALRIGLGAPKYALWVVMGVAAHFARATLPPPMGMQHAGAQAFPHWPALAMLSNACLLAVGWASRPPAPEIRDGSTPATSA